MNDDIGQSSNNPSFVLATSLYVGCYVVPGLPRSLGNLRWENCKDVATYQDAQFFGMYSWYDNGWDGHYYCIVLSQLATDKGVFFQPAQGNCCVSRVMEGFRGFYSQCGGIYAIYSVAQGTSAFSLAPPGSTIEIVHGKFLQFLICSILWYSILLS